MDKVFMQIENDFLSEERLVNFARDNDESMFKLIFEQEFMSKAMKRYEQNEKFFVKLFQYADFLGAVMNMLRGDVYRKMRA